jgi:uncharacterized protein YabN with tetrapyrrole methylase and pyrophosphatase domain
MTTRVPKTPPRRTRGAARRDARRTHPGKTTDARTADRAAREFRALVAIMQRLRAPDGCPWDREQTLESLRGFVLEETYEVLDAIDRADRGRLRGEIGDLLFEGVFLGQICAEDGDFVVADSIQDVTAKLIRRHPHVFGRARAQQAMPGAGRAVRTPARRAKVTTPDQVVEQWEQIKTREQEAAGQTRGVLAGVPAALPALLRAHEIGTRVAAVGFDWSRPEDVVAKIEEEVAELRQAVGHESSERAEEEMGDLLFSVANLCRKLGIEPESALRKANGKFTARFTAVERRLDARGRTVHDATLEEMEAEWQAVKEE